MTGWETRTALCGSRARHSLVRWAAGRTLVKLVAVIVALALSPIRMATAQDAPALRGPLGQSATPSQPLTLRDAVELALSNYPSVQASISRERARNAEIWLAKTAYLPKGT